MNGQLIRRNFKFILVFDFWVEIIQIVEIKMKLIVSIQYSSINVTHCETTSKYSMNKRCYSIYYIICLHNSSVRHFLLIFLKWRVGQTLLYNEMHSSAASLTTQLLTFLSSSHLGYLDGKSHVTWTWQHLCDTGRH